MWAIIVVSSAVASCGICCVQSFSRESGFSYFGHCSRQNSGNTCRYHDSRGIFKNIRHCRYNYSTGVCNIIYALKKYDKKIEDVITSFLILGLFFYLTGNISPVHRYLEHNLPDTDPELQIHSSGGFPQFF